MAEGRVWKEFSFRYFSIAEQKLLRTLLLPVLATSSLIQGRRARWLRKSYSGLERPEFLGSACYQSYS